VIINDSNQVDAIRFGKPFQRTVANSSPRNQSTSIKPENILNIAGDTRIESDRVLLRTPA